MNEQMTPIPPPNTLHPLTLQEADRTIRAHHATAGLCLVSWCPRTRAGGVYLFSTRMWAIYTPISSHEFVRTLSDRSIEIEDTAVRNRWLEALSRIPGEPSELH